MPKTNHDRVLAMPFAKIYPFYVTKVEKKGRSTKELEKVIHWLTGYTAKGIAKQIKNEVTMEDFFVQAPKLHPNVSKITGLICGERVEDIEDPLWRKVRYLDKLVDELARGKKMENILRA